MTFRSGFAAIVGRPNVGKSTLVNALVGEKIAIVSPKAQTTRSRIHGIINHPDFQLVLADTPGLTRRKGALNQALRRIAGNAAADCDLTLLLLEATDGAPSFAEEEQELYDAAKRAGRKIIVVLNKLDRLTSKAALLPWMAAAHERFGTEVIVPVSARTGDGLPELLQAIAALLPEGEALFPPDMHTDQAERFLSAELIREQLLRQLEQEVPHSAAVVIDSFEDGRPAPEADAGMPLPAAPVGQARPAPGLVRLEGRIVVERDSQKGIVVGKGGQRIKAISTAARADLEELLDAKVFLRLEVVVDRDWTGDAQALRRYGVTAPGED